ncbi:hypothetical protein [Deinococcus sp. RM]|uniref:hypothetical protein n=1 Tax=Deinococcus sp. RM TaxID=2316359 RepID=UPI0011C23853|nr:hypothetical protein [Deinococcus sp. RM]
MAAALEHLLTTTLTSLPSDLQEVIGLVGKVHLHPEGVPLSVHIVPRVTTDPENLLANGRLLHRGTSEAELAALGVQAHEPETAYVLMRGETAPLSANPRMTFLHELGHYLDHVFYSLSSPYASASYTYPLVVVLAANNSRLITDRKDELSVFISDAQNDDAKKSKYKAQIETDHHNKELFACAYAQWVATRSQDAKTLEELNRLRQNKQWMDRRYWDDDDFEPIGKQFDELKSAMGL